MTAPQWYFQSQAAVRPKGRPDLSLVFPNLLIGEYPHPDDVSWLKTEHHVTAVLCLQDDDDLASKAIRVRDLKECYGSSGVGFDRMPVPDCDLATFAARLD